MLRSCSSSASSLARCNSLHCVENIYGRTLAQLFSGAAVSAPLYHPSPILSRAARLSHHVEPIRRTRCFATKSKKSKRRGGPDKRPVPAYVEVLLALRTALDNEDIQGVIEAYGVLRTSFKLGADDAAALAQAVHTASRGRGEGEKKKRGAPELVAFATLLAEDIQSRLLPPSHTAHLHLLAFFKEAEQFDKGNNFWSWLVRQSDDYVDPSVYGAAIELCAAMGMSAETTEDMYMQALKRFPGSFNEYHLAPDAIVADRSLATNIKGIPMTLLQGILTARLLRGDTRDAYLALDTALRLYPTQAPPRFITLFITERPLPESYKVFMMACRSGIVVGHDGLKMLLTRLRTAASSSPVENATLLRAILTSTYAYAAAGGTLSSSPLTEVVTGLSRVLQDPAFATCSPEEAKEAADKLLTTVQQTFEIWNLHGSQPGIGAFNSIIANIAGKGKRMDVISTSLDNIETLGLEPTAVTRRSILTAAGHLQDRSLIKNAWLDLVDLRERAGTPVEPGDWNMLVKAAKKAGCLDLVKQQMAELDHALTSTVRKRISGQLEENEGDTNEKAAEKTKADSAQLVGFINLLHTDVHLMNEELRARPVRDFFLNPLPLSLGVSVDSMPEAVEEELRRVYDELTTDPQAREAPASISSTNTAPSTDTATSILSDVPGSTSGPSVRSDQDSPDDDNDPVKQSPEHEHPPPPPPPAISSTGFPFDELRYRNWQTVNELLAEAERHDDAYRRAVDEAIQKGDAPPKRDLRWKGPARNALETVGLADFLRGGVTEQGDGLDAGRDGAVAAMGREEVLRLRGRGA